MRTTIVNKNGTTFVINTERIKFLKVGYFKVVEPGDLSEQEVDYYNSKITWQ